MEGADDARGSLVTCGLDAGAPEPLRIELDATIGAADVRDVSEEGAQRDEQRGPHLARDLEHRLAVCATERWARRRSAGRRRDHRGAATENSFAGQSRRRVSPACMRTVGRFTWKS